MTPGGARFHAVSGLIFLSGVLVFLVAPPVFPEFVKTFDAEGGAIELLSAFFYLAGLVVCLYRIAAGRRGDRPYLYLWAAACFLFCGEETSWLQHVIGYGTPEAIEAANVQREFNIHNLGALESGSWHEFLTTGKFDYRLLLGASTWFRAGFFCYFVLLPIVLHAGFFGKIRERLGVPVPSVAFVAWLIVTMALSFIGYALHPALRLEITEARETYDALFILLYVVTHLGARRAASESRPAPTAAGAAAGT